MHWACSFCLAIKQHHHAFRSQNKKALEEATFSFSRATTQTSTFTLYVNTTLVQAVSQLEILQSESGRAGLSPRELAETGAGAGVRHVPYLRPAVSR